MLLRYFYAALCVLLLVSSVQGSRKLFEVPTAFPPAMSYMAADCQTFPREPSHVCKPSLIPACCNMATQLCQVRQPINAVCPALSTVGCCPNFNL